MSIIAALLLLAGSLICLLAAVGLVRMPTTATRVHAASKASPVAFLLAAAGAALETGVGGAARLMLAAVAVAVTLPVGVHALLASMPRETDATDGLDGSPDRGGGDPSDSGTMG